MNFIQAFFEGLLAGVTTVVHSVQLVFADWSGDPRPTITSWGVFPLNLCKLAACSLRVEFSLGGMRAFDSAVATVTGPDGSERELNMDRIDVDKFLGLFPGNSDVFAAGEGLYLIQMKIDNEVRKRARVTLLGEKTAITIHAAKTMRSMDLMGNPRQVEDQIHIVDNYDGSPGDTKSGEDLSICRKASRLLFIIYEKQTSGAVLGYAKIDLSAANPDGVWTELGHDLDPGSIITVAPPIFLSEIAHFQVFQQRRDDAPPFFEGDVVGWELTFVVGCVV